jgi:hypothetical protein
MVAARVSDIVCRGADTPALRGNAAHRNPGRPVADARRDRPSAGTGYVDNRVGRRQCPAGAGGAVGIAERGARVGVLDPARRPLPGRRAAHVGRSGRGADRRLHSGSSGHVPLADGARCGSVSGVHQRFAGCGPAGVAGADGVCHCAPGRESRGDWDGSVPGDGGTRTARSRWRRTTIAGRGGRLPMPSK